MKPFYAFILLIATTAIFSCGTDIDDLSDCSTGTVRFTCNSDNPYNVYIDNAFEAKLNGHTFTEIELLEGKHEVRAEQVSGYLLFPTIKSATLSVFGCKEIEWIFPQ